MRADYLIQALHWFTPIISLTLFLAFESELNDVIYQIFSVDHPLLLCTIGFLLAGVFSTLVSLLVAWRLRPQPWVKSANNPLSRSLPYRFSHVVHPGQYLPHFKTDQLWRIAGPRGFPAPPYPKIRSFRSRHFDPKLQWLITAYQQRRNTVMRISETISSRMPILKDLSPLKNRNTEASRAGESDFRGAGTNYSPASRKPEQRLDNRLVTQQQAALKYMVDRRRTEKEAKPLSLKCPPAMRELLSSLFLLLRLWVCVYAIRFRPEPFSTTSVIVGGGVLCATVGLLVLAYLSFFRIAYRMFDLLRQRRVQSASDKAAKHRETQVQAWKQNVFKFYGISKADSVSGTATTGNSNSCLAANEALDTSALPTWATIRAMSPGLIFPAIGADLRIAQNSRYCFLTAFNILPCWLFIIFDFLILCTILPMELEYAFILPFIIGIFHCNYVVQGDMWSYFFFGQYFRERLQYLKLKGFSAARWLVINKRKSRHRR